MAVLVVDDESMIRDLYAAWIGQEHEVRTAADGSAALAALDDDLDVVLLDRRMPGLPGDEVLERARERGVDVPVVMVSAVDPAVDVADLPFDDYLVKPADAEDLRTAVAVGRERGALDGTERSYARVLAKLGLLEHHHVTGVDEALASLREQRAALRSELGGAADRLDERAAAGELVVQPPSDVAGD